ncbi:TPA: TIGR03986 family CRISPR-associated RAMP protein [Bacillus paranthracis]
MKKGTIKRYIPQKNIGFIAVKGQNDVFFHITKVEREQQDFVQEGIEVEFTSKAGQRGPEAIKVKLLNIDVNQNVNQKFHNPYNFVSWSESAAPHTELAKQATTLNSGHNSGTIECCVHLESPLFISGEGIRGKKDHGIYEFFKKDGTYAIPGSTLRGMVRSVYEAATNSCFSVLQENDHDEPLFYRGNSGMSQELIPARIIEKDGQLHAELLTGHVTKKEKGKKLLYAGWVLEYTRKWTGNSNTPYNARKIPKLPSDIKNGDKVYAILSNKTAHRTGRFEFYNVEEMSKEKENLSNPDQVIEGYYYKSGFNFPRKHDERFFYRIKEERISTDNTYPFKEMLLEVEESVLKQYNSLLKNYREVNEGKPSHQVSRHISEDTKLKVNDLVYVLLDEEEKSVIEMYPVMISRKQYKQSVQDILLEHLKKCHLFNELCPACRLFGWTKGEKAGENEEKAALKTRIYVSDAIFNQEKDKGTYQDTLEILGTPKPTAIPMYLRPKSATSKVDKVKYFKKGYDEEEATIRGRKIYRSHSKQPKQHNAEPGNQNRTLKDILKTGNEFTFKIEFHNLTDVELGALIWCLQLEEGMKHRLGYGKPFGFGQISITVGEIEKYEVENRYSSWNNVVNAAYSLENQKEKVAAFKEEMQTAFAAEFLNIQKVQDLMNILTPNADDLDIHYPRAVQATSGKQFEWFGKNKNNGAKSKELYKEVLEYPNKNNIGLSYNGNK